MECVFGIDVGGTNIKLAVIDREGQILDHRKIATRANEGPDAVISRLANELTSFIQADQGWRIRAVGLAVAGAIDARAGVVMVSPNLTGWRNVPLAERLSEMTGYQVVVENDANMAAFGEGWLGVGRSFQSFLVMTLGTGIGGGLILDGWVWSGPFGCAGEIGHITVDPEGWLCNCGNTGCLETIASATGVVRMASELLAQGGSPVLENLINENGDRLTAEIIATAAFKGDALANQVFQRVGRVLGLTAVNLYNLLGLEMIAFSGGMAGAFDLLIGPMREEIKRRSHILPPENLKLLKGILGDDAGTLGAARMAWRHIDLGERPGCRVS
ncbi:MAG: ROK family protein [Deltaproteobacteria bacterium]|nr:ROK family protein [Deltaproteobacteria bacterium]